MTSATQDWPSRGFPTPDGPNADRFGPTAGSTIWLYVSSLLLADGESNAGVKLKASDMDDAMIGEMDAEAPLMCTLSNRHAVTVDGVAGRQEDQFCFGKDYLIESLVSNDVRLYLVDILSRSPLTDADRATYDRSLASFTFGE